MFFLIRTIILTIAFTLVSNCYTNSDTYFKGSDELDLSQVDWENQNPLNINRSWEFYWNQLYEPKDFESGIALTKINGNVRYSPWTSYNDGTQKYPASGFATYRIKIKVKENNELKSFSIYHTHVFSASKLFINGKLLLEKGKISSDLTKLVSNRTNSHLEINTQDHYLEIIMQIANQDFYYGGPRGEFLIGSPKQIEFYKIKGMMVEIFVFGLIFGSVVYHLFFFLLNRSQAAFLYFSIVCLSFLVRIPFLNSKLYEYIIPVLSFDALASITHYMTIASFIAGNLFLNVLFHKRKVILINFTFYLGGILAIFFPFLPGMYSYLFFQLYLIFFLFLFLVHSIYLLSTNQTERQSSLLMGFGLFGLAVFCFLAIYLNYIGVQGGILLLLGYSIYVIFQSVSLSKYFAFAIESRASLELKHSTENQIALSKQRSEMQLMMHDNLGAGLTDLKVYLEKIMRQSNSTSLEINLQVIQERIISIIKSLRNQLLFIEDLDVTYENFLTGLNLTLLRRYTDAGRELDFKLNNDLSVHLQSLKLIASNRDYYLEIFYMMYELCTNDLKYGAGESTWHLFMEKDHFAIVQSNLTKENSNNKALVLKSIGMRISNLKGTIQSEIKVGKFQVIIQFPYKF